MKIKCINLKFLHFKDISEITGYKIEISKISYQLTNGPSYYLLYYGTGLIVAHSTSQTKRSATILDWTFKLNYEYVFFFLIKE